MAPIDRPAARKTPIWSLSVPVDRCEHRIAWQHSLKVLNNLADIKSAGVSHFASELRPCLFDGPIRLDRCLSQEGCRVADVQADSHAYLCAQLLEVKPIKLN